LNERPLSILLTHECYLPDMRGGGEYVVHRTAKALQDRGLRVRVLTTGDPTMTAHDGIMTERLPISRYRLNLQSATIAQAAKDVDLIQTFTYHACLPSLWAGRRLGIPVVCEVLALFGATWRAMRGPILGRAFQGWERFLVAQRYDGVVFLSESSRLQGVASGVDPERSWVNAPGLDHTRLRPTAAREAFVLFAGKLDARKGIHHLFTVARALPNISFRAVGWSDEIAELRASAPPNLTIIDDRGSPAYVDLLGRALILLAPSYAETFGVVVAEAMASGCAIVSSIDTLSFHGACVSPGDEAAMIAAVSRLWADPAGTAELGRRNRIAAAVYTWGSHVDRLIELYQAVLPRLRALKS
jgi:glycosyltransferase involved in cell wall biosynthesis